MQKRNASEEIRSIIYAAITIQYCIMFISAVCSVAFMVQHEFEDASFTQLLLSLLIPSLLTLICLIIENVLMDDNRIPTIMHKHSYFVALIIITVLYILLGVVTYVLLHLPY